MTDAEINAIASVYVPASIKVAEASKGGLGKTVDLTGLTAGDTLVYDAVNDKFVKGTASGTGNMNTSVYDVNSDGIVNQADKVDGGTF